MSEWQPIETAPRDGTEILTLTRWPAGDYARVLCWDDGIDLETGGVATGWLDPDSGYIGSFDPSYWMPLPKPPEPSP